jgi:flagellar biosynthesis protein FliR
MGPISLAQFLPTNVFGALLIFTRIGTAMTLLPGFGEIYVPQRYRLLLAVILSMLLLPILQPILPVLPSSPSELTLLLGGEAVIGVFIGTLTRFVLAALESAGQIVSIQSGLSAALVFNPLQATQSSVPSTLYGLLGVLLIFLTDMHHMMLRGLLESYMIFAPGKMPLIGDLSQTVAHAAAESFRLALEIAAPFVVLGTIFFVALGLIGRLVPQIQVLFVSQPLQILGGLVVFGLVISAGMNWFLDAMVQQFNIIVPG